MAWIELHQGIRKHKKVLRLAALLGLQDPDHARVKLENLWLWALDSCLDGRLTTLSRGGVVALTDLEIASVSEWHGDATLWLRSLIDAGWIDERQGGVGGKTMYLHDWQEYAGKLKARRDYDRERKAKDTSAGIPTAPTRNSVGTVPYRTVPNQTKEEEGADAPTPPPTGAPQGSEKTEPRPTPDVTEIQEIRKSADVYGAWPHPTLEKKLEAIAELRGMGCSHDYIRNGAQVNKPADSGFWDIVKALKAAHGIGRKAKAPGPQAELPDEERTRVNGNPTGHKPPVLRERREVVHARQDAARKKTDEVIAKMDPKKREDWTAQAELEAQKAGIPSGGPRQIFIATQLRIRAAEEFKIEGL